MIARGATAAWRRVAQKARKKEGTALGEERRGEEGRGEDTEEEEVNEGMRGGS